MTGSDPITGSTSGSSSASPVVHALKTDNDSRRFTLFPIYFQQRSVDPEKNYTAVFPFYGHLQNRIFRDEITFLMFPLYSKTLRRGGALPDIDFKSYRSRGITFRTAGLPMVTYNYLYPIVHVRYADGLQGWQVWPWSGTSGKLSRSRPTCGTKSRRWAAMTSSSRSGRSTSGRI